MVHHLLTPTSLAVVPPRDEGELRQRRPCFKHESRRRVTSGNARLVSDLRSQLKFENCTWRAKAGFAYQESSSLHILFDGLPPARPATTSKDMLQISARIVRGRSTEHQCYSVIAEQAFLFRNGLSILFFFESDQVIFLKSLVWVLVFSPACKRTGIHNTHVWLNATLL